MKAVNLNLKGFLSGFFGATCVYQSCLTGSLNCLVPKPYERPNLSYSELRYINDLEESIDLLKDIDGFMIK